MGVGGVTCAKGLPISVGGEIDCSLTVCTATLSGLESRGDQERSDTCIAAAMRVGDMVSAAAFSLAKEEGTSPGGPDAMNRMEAVEA